MTTVSTDSNGVKNYIGSADSLTTGSKSVMSQQKLGQDDFLRLLTAQLQAQDPLNPVQNADLVAQMATITTTSGISEMNQSMANISAAVAKMEGMVTSARFGDAASWIGRDMLVESNYTAPGSTGNYNGQVTLSEAGSDVSVRLVDSNGATVKTINLGSQNKGDVAFHWDGRDDAGNYVAGDSYKIEVSGATASSIASWTSIAAIQSPADSTASKLITPLGTFKPSDALKLL
ncbi:MAG: flagellar hook capping protein [Sphingobium sp.]|nr:flagellar hook capping protein [Sphingobium sp.]